MKVIDKRIRKTFKFVKKNYLITTFIFIVGLILLIVAYKLLSSKDEIVYAKVKVSQGFWWANTLKPSYWLADSLKKGDVELSLSGKPIVEILEVRRYPIGYAVNGSEQYDVYLTVKMKADLNKKTNTYTFKRSKISIGTPIDFEFQNTAVSGTIMNLSDEPFKKELTTKVVTLQKTQAEQWEYEAIQEGATYFDGEEVIVTVVDKSAEDAYSVYNSIGNNYPIFTEPPVNIQAIVQIKLAQNNDEYIFRDEIPMILGKSIDLPLNNFILNDFIISSIE